MEMQRAKEAVLYHLETLTEFFARGIRNEERNTFLELF